MKAAERVFMKCSGYIEYDTRNNAEHLGMFQLTHCTQELFFSFFSGNACLLATLRRKGEQIFMKFSGQVEYTTRNNLEQFLDVYDMLDTIQQNNELNCFMPH